MSLWNRIFGKKEENDVKLYMEERIRGHDTSLDTRKGKKRQEKASMEKIELTKREEALLQGDLSVIPEQYYFLKDDKDDAKTGETDTRNFAAGLRASWI